MIYMDNQFFQSAQYIQVTFLGTNKVKNEKILLILLINLRLKICLWA